MRKQKNKKTNRVAIIAALLVCVLMLGGTIAWLTSTSELTNEFTVGQINPVDPDDIGPDGNEIPDEDEDEDIEEKLTDNLYEPSWTPGSKLLPGATISKDPYVGLGVGSEESYVFVYVENTMTNNNHIYFALKDGWSAVEEKATAVTVGENTYYTGGLFMYDETLTGAETGNVWTSTPVFSEVIVDDNAVAEDFVDSEGDVGSITVTAYVHQAKSGDATTDLKETAIAAAKAAF